MEKGRRSRPLSRRVGQVGDRADAQGSLSKSAPAFFDKLTGALQNAAPRRHFLIEQLRFCYFPGPGNFVIQGISRSGHRFAAYGEDARTAEMAGV